MKEIQRILSFMRRAVDDYGMIREGDRIAVGISGGKDSLTLLVGMAELRRFYPIPFSLAAITVDMGFPGSDFSPIAALCRELDVEYRVEKTDIARIIFEERKEPNPCSLCARMRRGVLHGAAKEMGCTAVALGHHFDDAVETFMLNLFFEGRLGCFSPVTYLSNRDLYMIRPLLYAKERDVTMRVFYRFEPDEAHPGHVRILCKIKCPINPLPVRGEFEIPNMAVLKRFLLAAGWVEHDCMNLSDVE